MSAGLLPRNFNNIGETDESDKNFITDIIDITRSFMR